MKPADGQGTAGGSMQVWVQVQVVAMVDPVKEMEECCCGWGN
jgi:hypothetical protein